MICNAILRGEREREYITVQYFSISLLVRGAAAAAAESCVSAASSFRASDASQK